MAKKEVIYYLKYNSPFSDEDLFIKYFSPNGRFYTTNKYSEVYFTPDKDKLIKWNESICNCELKVAEFIHGESWNRFVDSKEK